ncbi:hypothetical protein [Cerasicoccus frondis]|uniref:hypothetical protein n=1 Tax=Cerasicoccus frondis TaxID=490090 RepID=UPI0028526211|nr:hypothetical protein [Cerasicoccus frondis]
MKRSPPNQSQGFALVIALSLMAFILMLCLSLTTLVRVEMQSIHVQHDVSLARSNALLGLQIALGELQKSAGPDQRVTATADLVDGLADDTHRRWTGVWDVSNRDPFVPFSSATQVDWLISGKDLSGNDLIPGGEVLNPVMLHEDASNPSNEVVVGLESINNQWGNGHYAYWVADEGVKAKVNLTDPHRLSSGLAANDYHFSQMTGQRTGIEKITLPDSSVIGDYMDPLDSSIESQIERMSTLDQLPLIESGLADLPTILLHDLTTSSLGVLANVAEGGLKQDLSLAFEMDLDDFNADTNFAAGGESLAPGVNGTITGHEIRYLFTHDYTPNGDGIRGPTWHLLRNYYRLYLQNDPDRFVDYKTAHPRGVERQGNRYTIDSRPFFPQMQDGTSSNNYSLPAALYSTGTYDMNVSNFYGGGTTRVPRPTDMQIHPVVTRVQLFLSLQAVKVFPDPDSTDYKYRIDLLASPVVTIWNPYNVELDFEQMHVNWNFLILPMEFSYREPGEALQTINLKLGDANETKNFSYAGLICYLEGSTLAPGQVKVYSTVDSIGEKAGSSGKVIYREPIALFRKFGS